MTLATTIKSGTTAMTKAVSQDTQKGAPGFAGGEPTDSPVFHGGVNPPLPEATKMLHWPNPLPDASDSYEIRRKLPMALCVFCTEIVPSPRKAKPRRSSWLYRKKGWYLWYRVCFEHMNPRMRAVIKEMYAR